MKRRRFFCSFLLAYLVLFLNLGPAWHRLPALGLHDTKASSACDCGLVHETPAPDNLLKDSGLFSDGLDNDQVCDCALCRYFEHFQFTVDHSPIAFFADRSFRKTEVFTSASAVVSINQRARAPPVVA